MHSARLHSPRTTSPEFRPSSAGHTGRKSAVRAQPIRRPSGVDTCPVPTQRILAAQGVSATGCQGMQPLPLTPPGKAGVCLPLPSWNAMLDVASLAATSLPYTARQSSTDTKRFMEIVTALQEEVMTLKQEMVELRQDVQVQIQSCDRRCQTRLGEAEGSLRNAMSEETATRSVEIQSACESLEIELKKVLSKAMEMERDTREQEVAKTHAAMVAHGTYVVSRLEDYASGGEGNQGNARAVDEALRRALQAGRAQAPAGTVLLDRIEEECATHFGEGVSKCTCFPAEQTLRNHDAACSKRWCCGTPSCVDSLLCQSPFCRGKRTAIDSDMVGTDC